METVLYSTDNATLRQRAHNDLPRELANQAVLAFVCLEPNTTIIMFRSSHKSIGVIGEDVFPHVYELRVGDVLLFHPLLVHAGDRYSVSNMRLHYYVMNLDCDWVVDTTYTVPLRASSDLAEALLQSARTEQMVQGKQKESKRKKAISTNRGVAGIHNLVTHWASEKKRLLRRRRKLGRLGSWPRNWSRVLDVF